MARVSFRELMHDADAGQYAVGYFESWNLESLQAVADAAEMSRSPVILGFSGIYLPHRDRIAKESLADYAAMAGSVADRLSVPCCLLFNECPCEQWVRQAIALHFDLVMFSDPDLPTATQTQTVSQIAAVAHEGGVAIEGELTPLHGVAGTLTEAPAEQRLTSARDAQGFIRDTGVDALAVNVGQVHLHGRREVGLDLDLLAQIRDAVEVPLVLHGATSVRRDDLRAAIRHGVRKINVGSVLKQVFLRAMADTMAQIRETDNPYEVIGSGFQTDVLARGRLAMRDKVMELMEVFGSVGRAGEAARKKELVG